MQSPQPQPPVVNEPIRVIQPAQPRYRTLLVGSSLLIAVAIIGILVLLAHKSSTSIASVTTGVPAVAQVAVTPDGFSPASISIKKGSSVEFTSTDMAPHWVESDPYPSATSLPALDATAAIGSGDSFTAVINSAGTYTYHDRLNPTVTGTVIVTN